MALWLRCPWVVVAALFFPALVHAQSSASSLTAGACERLLGHALPNVHITAAAVAPAADGVPASCRVAATLTPTADSAIKVEVWMPMTGWNGKFHSAGGAEGANSAVGDLPHVHAPEELDGYTRPDPS
jgi:hypothetical protein